MNQVPPFAAQRLIFMALLLGMVMFVIVIAVLLHQQDGKGFLVPPVPALDTAAVILGFATVAGALVLRRFLGRAGAAAAAPARGAARFRAVMIPLAVLESGCVFALTVWLLNGNSVPNLVVALVILSIAIAIVPFTDPEPQGR
jgi:hypothetical protein